MSPAHAEVFFYWNTNEPCGTNAKMAYKRKYGIPFNRRVRRRISRNAMRSRSLSRAGRYGRAAGKFTRRFGLKGVAVGLGARALIGSYRSLKKAKVTETFKDTATIGTRTLKFESLTNITKADTIDGRERHNIQLSGIKILGEFQNVINEPLYLNVAVVHVRDLTNQPEHEFFRHDGTVRAIDFGNELSSLEFHFSNLNTDKYGVLKHGRYRLNAGNSTEASGRTYMNLNWYIPIKRSIQYDGDAGASVDPGSNIYLLYWCDIFNTVADAGVSPAALNTQFKVKAYHHDP